MIVFVAVVALLLALLYYLHERNQVFPRLGVRTINPRLLVGDLPSFDFEHLNIMAQKSMRNAVESSPNKTAGFMYGGTPMLVTGDVHILNDVFSKKFDCFSARPRVPLGPSADKCIDVFQSKAAEWKRQRAIINRCFSTGNIKAVYDMVNQRSDVLLQRLDEAGDRGGIVDCNVVFYKYTLDVIAKIIFDDHADYQTGDASLYENFLKLIFVFSPWLRLVCMCLPELADLWHFVNRFKIAVTSGKSVLSLLGRITRTIEDHKEGKVEKHDFVQFMLDAALEEGEEELLEKGGKHLTQNEIIRNSLVLLFAGSDTTAVTLSYFTVLLAVHPHHQANVYEEVIRVCGEEGQEITYDMLDELPLLEGGLREALRLYPQSTGVVNRCCVRACTVGRGESTVDVPLGMLVQAETWSLHRDVQLWGDDAQEFVPERWQRARVMSHPMAFMSFGGGRRVCVGQRLAFTEVKSTMAKIIRRFEIVRCPETLYPFELRGTASPEPRDAFVRMVHRRGAKQ